MGLMSFIKRFTGADELESHSHKRQCKSAKSVEDIVDQDIVFLVTPGRSGTKTLIEYLKENSDLCAVHAATPWLASVGFKLWQGEISSDAAFWSYYACRERYLKFCYERDMVFVDGDCKNLPLLPALANFLPRSRFVHIYRDPVNFIISGLNRGYYQDKPPELWGHLYGDKKVVEASGFNERARLIADFWECSNRIASDIAGLVGSDRFASIKSEEMFMDHREIDKAFSGFGLGQFGQMDARALAVKNRNRLNRGDYDIDYLKSLVTERCESARVLYDDY